MNETVKDEATFEDKMVDIMVLEDPQNMYQALEKWVDPSRGNYIILYMFNLLLIDFKKSPPSKRYGSVILLLL